MRIHPVQRKAFLDVEFPARVGLEDNLRQQRIDGHHCHLAADLDATVDDANVFARLDLAWLGGGPAVMIEAFLGVGQELPEGILDLVCGRHADLVGVGGAEVVQVTSVGQRVLRDGE